MSDDFDNEPIDDGWDQTGEDTDHEEPEDD
jgi:hypothetical protein